MFEIKNNLIYVEGKETKNPELIGYAILDLVSHYKCTIEIKEIAS